MGPRCFHLCDVSELSRSGLWIVWRVYLHSSSGIIVSTSLCKMRTLAMVGWGERERERGREKEGGELHFYLSRDSLCRQK